MEQYVGLDVSLKQTAICIVDRSGKVVREAMVSSDPEAIASFVRANATNVVRIGLESGSTSTWLWTELNRMELPVICIDARHAKAALKMQINKNDRNDAAGIARIMQTGWYREVRVKALDSHAIKALLLGRALLVKMKRDIEHHIRTVPQRISAFIGRIEIAEHSGTDAESIEFLANEYDEKAKTAIKVLAGIATILIRVSVMLVLIFLIFRLASVYIGALNSAMAPI